MAVRRSCFAAPLAAGTPGVVVRPVTTQIDGDVVARLTGSPRGDDWDLAVFDALTGRLLGASAAFGGNELVRQPVAAGRKLLVQACRYGGGPEPIGLTVGELVVSGDVPRPETESLVTVAVKRQQDVEELHEAGIDLNETGTKAGIDAVLHGPGDAATLTRLGYAYRVKVPDLAAADRKSLRADPVGDVVPSGLPSGRRSYRHLADYQQDLKDLVAAHPTAVRPLVLPHKSVEGRTVEGVEIATDVARTDDGRPTVFELGLHHVREWSSGEMTMEHALDLFKATSPADGARKKAILDGVRTFAIPVVNPDGLEATQVAGDYMPADDANAELPPETPGLGGGGYGAGTGPAVAGAGSYRRKNCANDPASGVPTTAPCALQSGVDLNRNYAAFWGGPGESSSFDSQTFRGPSPFSEPETQNVHELSSAHQVMVVNSNHNYAGDVLFQPGFNGADEPGFPKGTIPPYQPAMKALADKMAAAANYASFVSYNLYDVTGATEDWNYFAQGAFGYTTEVGYGNFHPNYQDAVIDQFLGTIEGPGNTANGRKPSKGLRESLLLAAEAAIAPENHAQLMGTAPAGRVLRLTKDFTTSTSFVESDDSDKPGPALQVPEHLESTLTVPASGSWTWAVNPSTRPVKLLAKETEAWTLTCEDPATRQVLERRQVTVGIGERSVQDFECRTAATSPTGPTPTQPAAQPSPPPPPSSSGTSAAPGPGAPGANGAAGPAGGPGAPGTVTVVPATPKLRLEILRPEFSARRTTRMGGLRLFLRIANGSLRDVRATITTPRGKLLLSGRAAALRKSGRIPLKRRARLVPGAVRVTVTALDAKGKRVRTTRASRLLR